MKNIKQYYKELGKMVYSIAVADGIIQPEERLILHKLVTKELAHNETSSDSSGMNQAFYVDFEFEWLEEQHADSVGIIAGFKHFIEANIEAGDEELIERSIKLMESVATAYTRNKEKNIVEQAKDITSLYLKLKRELN